MRTWEREMGQKHMGEGQKHIGEGKKHMGEGQKHLVERHHEEVWDRRALDDVDELNESDRAVRTHGEGCRARGGSTGRGSLQREGHTHLAEHAEDVAVGDGRHHGAIPRDLAHDAADLGVISAVDRPLGALRHLGGGNSGNSGHATL